MRSENVGQIRIIEALLAMSVIFSSLAISTNLATVPNDAGQRDLGSIGFRVLMQLDSDGALCAHIENGNWVAIRRLLAIMLPSETLFNMTVYNEDMQQINAELICNGDLSDHETVSIEYVAASLGPVFRVYLIQLMLATIHE
ncbi:MAG: hypothetical protein QHH24_03360 [Candidatus Bathyarchaeota archaeon]|nr:hypothetical protein [Candidatus Bathyarchaeota archaeon]